MVYTLLSQSRGEYMCSYKYTAMSFPALPRTGSGGLRRALLSVRTRRYLRGANTLE